MEKQIALVEVWLGKIPDYFKYHIETIGSITCCDFYFFTNDVEYDFTNINHPNFILGYITEEEFLGRYNHTSKVKINNISHPKKIIDFKLAYFDMFNDIVEKYPYVGIYDIDTMFGNINPLLLDYTKEYDFISVGEYRRSIFGVPNNELTLLDCSIKSQSIKLLESLSTAEEL